MDRHPDRRLLPAADDVEVVDAEPIGQRRESQDPYDAARFVHYRVRLSGDVVRRALEVAREAPGAREFDTFVVIDGLLVQLTDVQFTIQEVVR